MKVKRTLFSIIIGSLLFGSCAFGALPVGGPVQLRPIDTSGFQSSISHWRSLNDDTRFIKVVEGQASYKPTQVREIVDNILLFQRMAMSTSIGSIQSAVKRPDLRSTRELSVC